MSNLYSKYPAFINSDPRKERMYPYPASASYMQIRHDTIFQNINLKNKKILDLGCCVGYTGAYVLDKDCKEYHGVEFSSELFSIASSNLTNNFKDNFSLINDSAENFVKHNKDSYDVTVLLGLLYAIKDPVCFLENILSFSEIVIIESAMPHFSTNDNLQFLNRAYITYDQQNINHTNSTQNATFVGCRPSIGLIKLIFESNGFEVDMNVNQMLHTKFSKIFHNGENGRFLIMGQRKESKHIPIGYIDTVVAEQLSLSNFLKLS